MVQVFFCEFCEISKNTFFTEHLRETASEVTSVVIYTSLFTLTCLYYLHLSILMFSLYYYINLIKLIKYGKYRNHDEIFYIEECF